MRREFVLDLAFKITKGYRVKSLFKIEIAREIKRVFYEEFNEFMNFHRVSSLVNLDILFGALLRLGLLDAKIKRAAYYVVREVLKNTDKDIVREFARIMSNLIKNDALDDELKTKILQATFG